MKLGCPLGAQLPEEPKQRLNLTVFSGPNHPAREMVDHHGQVPVTLAVANLVHSNDLQSVQPLPLVPLLLYHPTDDPPNRAPRDAEILGHRAQVAPLSQPGDFLLEGNREAAAVLGPGHLLFHHTTAPADHTPDPVAQKRFGAK